MIRFLPFLLLGSALWAQPQLLYEQNQTLSYAEVLEAYRYYDQQSEQARLMEIGRTDAGEPLHLFLLGKHVQAEALSLPEMARGQTVLLINNGIHPGESCGIDASLLLVEELLKAELPDSVLLAIIPVYNVGGALNRNSYSRANQDGPEEHGFRGNAINLDLNRDFIKADALNTLSFYAIFQAFQPHIFVDTHTSNGADYQYTMSLISTQKDKLNPLLADYLSTRLEPYLYHSMDSVGWTMTPYVNVFGRVPDHGFSAFLETPRYASGYTALFNTIGFVTEAHMLKPYPDRVEATYHFLRLLTQFVFRQPSALRRLKARAIEEDLGRPYFALNWELDSNTSRPLLFKGYAYSWEQSQLHGGRHLQYQRSRPLEFEVKYYHRYTAVDSAEVPEYYVLPAAWRQVALRLQANGIAMIPLPTDTVLAVEQFRIRAPEFADYPYEGHFPLQKFTVLAEESTHKFQQGDWLIPTDQPGRRFIVNTLEAKAADSYLRWNFFDPIFQQKEYFSAYVFEQTAAQMLAGNPALKREFEQWKDENPQQAQDSYAALSYIYRHSPYYEPGHLLYPVFRLAKP